MNKEKLFFQRKKIIDLLRKEKDETLGAMKQVQKELKKEFGCKDPKETKKKIKKLEKKLKESNEKINKEWEAFEKKFRRLVRALEEDNPKIYRIAKLCLIQPDQGEKSGKKAKKRSR